MKDKDYQKALKREAYREIHWRNTQQGAFEFAFGSLDAFTERFDDPGKIAAFSDKGKGEAAIFKHYDEADRERLIDAALKRLKTKDRAFARAVLAGKTWREIGYDEKSYFYKRLKKICKKVSGEWPLPPSKTAL